MVGTERAGNSQIETRVDRCGSSVVMKREACPRKLKKESDERMLAMIGRETSCKMLIESRSSQRMSILKDIWIMIGK